MLGLATSDNTHEGAGGVDQQNKIDASAAALSGLFPALTTSDMKGLLQALETMAGGTVGTTENIESLPADGSGVSDKSAAGSSTTSEQQVEKLLLGLLALVAAKEVGSGGSMPERGADGQEAADAQGGSPGAARQGTAKNATASDAPASSDDHSTQGSTGSNDQETLETLALLVFHSLQAVFQGQDQVASTIGGGANGAFSGDGESVASAGQGATQKAGEIMNGVAPESGQATPVDTAGWQKIIDNGVASGESEQAMPVDTIGWQKIIDSGVPSGDSPSKGAMPAEEEGSGKNKTIPAEDGGPVRSGAQDPLKQDLERTSTKEASWKEKAGGLLENIPGAGKAVSGQAAENKSSAGPSIGLTPSGDDGRGTNGLSLVIKGTQGSTPYTGPDGVTGEMSLQNVAGGSQQGENKDDSVATALIHDLSPLLEGQGENASKENTGDKEQPSGQENYQLSGGSDSGAAASTAQEQSGKVSDRSTAGEAVEKFQQVLEQFSGKTGQHGLTVKLDIGSEGSLVLGMKDLGQTVTVEVRASHDATVSLLQSQRDTIIRHLEGKDVHTNIVIDPNASGTPEKRDRRDTQKQRTFPSAPKEDEGFGELLDMLV
jgi:hypothetical protein